MSLRLRGASVSDPNPKPAEAEHTHVLVVTADAFARAPAARAGLDGARFGVGRHATWVNAAWIRARIDEGKPV